MLSVARDEKEECGFLGVIFGFFFLAVLQPIGSGESRSLLVFVFFFFFFFFFFPFLHSFIFFLGSPLESYSEIWDRKLHSYVYRYYCRIVMGCFHPPIMCV